MKRVEWEFWQEDDWTTRVLDSFNEHADTSASLVNRRSASRLTLSLGLALGTKSRGGEGEGGTRGVALCAR